jgi:hypothetical protein
MFKSIWNKHELLGRETCKGSFLYNSITIQHYFRILFLELANMIFTCEVTTFSYNLSSINYYVTNILYDFLLGFKNYLLTSI